MWLAVVPRAFMIHPDHLLVLFQQWKGSAYLHSKGHLLSSCLPQLLSFVRPFACGQQRAQFTRLHRNLRRLNSLPPNLSMEFL